MERCIEGFLAAGRGGYVTHPRVYLLPALAGVADWATLSEQIAVVTETVEQTRTKGDPDMVRAVTVAVQRAESAGEAELASQLRALQVEVG